jgi:NAD(P)-dependent dehydrogenase (short-subunit alcohol dehydrogenase family)
LEVVMSDPVLVFGATGGIGRAIATRLAHAGVRLVLSARSVGPLTGLAAELGAEARAADVTDTAALAAVVEAAGPRLAGLVFAVGSIELVPLRRAEEVLFTRTFALNVTAAAQAVRQAQPALAAAGGAVVLFSSVAARRGFKSHAVIGSAKAAVEGLTVALAAELAPKVRVNCIAPTLTRTPLAAALTASPPMAEQLARLHPLGRLGEADDVAEAAVFLLGPGGAFVTGQVLAVDGGRSTIAG